MFPASSSSFRSYDNVSRWSPRHNQLRTLVDATENWSVIGFISNKKERKRRRELNRYHKWQNRLNIPSSSSWDKKCQQLEKWFLFHRHSFFKPASHPNEKPSTLIQPWELKKCDFSSFADVQRSLLHSPDWFMHEELDLTSFDFNKNAAFKISFLDFVI